MMSEELKQSISEIETNIKQQQAELRQLKKTLIDVLHQEKERQNYISSKEIIDLIDKNIGRKVNMSTIKRWADEGYLGEVVEEKDIFSALRTKQGKKRFLYPIVEVYHFLYEKGYLLPKYQILDPVVYTLEDNQELTGIVVDAKLTNGAFIYTIQIDNTTKLISSIKENNLTINQKERVLHES